MDRQAPDREKQTAAHSPSIVTSLRPDGTNITDHSIMALTPQEYPYGTRLAVIVISLMLAMFLVALDNTVLGTAIPKITDEFSDLKNVSWYGSAYFMTFGGGFQSTWGKFYKFFPIKFWFLVAVLIFESGSLICGLAQNSTTLIVGRAIAGFGASGVGVGVFTILAFSTSPEKRPRLLGFTGATYGIAAVLGPLIGGAFTERISWRWCFYVNLPIGGLAAAAIFLFFDAPHIAAPAKATYKEKFLQMDLVGASLMMGMIIAYITALQYGGQTYSWSTRQVIGLLIGFFLIFLIFVAWEIYQKERAMIVTRLFMKNYIYVGSIFMFFFGGAYFVILYYLPIYFQSIYNNSPIECGINMLALIIPVALTGVVQGLALSKIGVVPFFWIVGGALGAVGGGLLYTLDSHTSAGKWIGYQILVGATAGGTFQVAMSNAQIHATSHDMSQATAIVNFFTTVGGALFLSAAQAAFNNQLIKTIVKELPEVNPGVALRTGATQIREVFTASQIPMVIEGYSSGIKAVFAITIAAFGVATTIGFFGSWKRL